ncbi:MAG TPA: hypothetical protein DEF45_03280 [Rhodopirellula sp.]|nr:hypothetical protein [Rhodopirellula sp.]
MQFLKNHPFAVDAHFESSLVLTFAAPKEQVQPLIPECLRLDTFDDTWAFIAIAMVQTRHLRPKGFPQFMGNDFFLIGYRVFVRYATSEGKRLRGLYIMKSETNKRKMQFFGNAFTHYNYTTTDISQSVGKNVKTISSNKSKFRVEIDTTKGEVNLPTGSPFSSWKEARRFAGPLPNTFTVNAEDKSTLIIKGVRSNWKPSPVKVNSYKFSFLDSLNLKGTVLANCFEIRDIPYSWNKGRLDSWG